VTLAFDPAHVHVFVGDRGASVLAPDAPPAAAPPLEPDAPDVDAALGERSPAL